MKNIHTVSCSASIFSLGIWGQETHPFQKWPEKKVPQHLKIMKMKMTLSLNEYGLTLSTLQNTQLKKKILVTRIILVSCQKRQKVKDDDSMGLKLPKAARKNHNVCKNTVTQVLIYMYM